MADADAAVDGAGAAPPSAGAPPPPADAPVFVSFREVRQPPARSGRRAGYHLEFMLVHRDGGETLAAVGDDAGDAHYRYVSAAGFAPPARVGALRARNRRDLQTWLDAVIAASQADAGFHVVAEEEAAAAAKAAAAGDGAPPADGARAPRPPRASASPPPVPAYIAHRSTKTEAPDGRRHMRWWLVDADGVEHAAAVGEERGPKDGHYSYRALASLPGGAGDAPLQNQAAVLKYLEAMIAGTGGGEGGGDGGWGGGGFVPPATATAAAAAAPAAFAPPPAAAAHHAHHSHHPLHALPPPADGDGPPKPTVAALAAGHPAGRAGLAAALAAALPSANALDGVADAALAVRRVETDAAREAAARLAVAAEARARAARAAAGLTAAKRVALAWLRGAPRAATLARAAAAADKLTAALDALDALPAGAPPAVAAPPLVAAHDALRDVAGLAVGPKLAAAAPAVVAATRRAATCSRDASVAAAADRVLAGWRGAAGARLAALTRRDALADPEDAVEGVLAEGAARIAAAAGGVKVEEGEAMQVG